MTMELRFKKLRVDAVLPSKAHGDDAGFDLYLPDESGPYWLNSTTEPEPISLGIAWEGPPNHYAQIVGRSSLGARGIVVLAGCIDAGFRGEWKVVLRCLDEADVMLKPGDRIAQFVLLPVPPAVIIGADDLSDTPRGEGGFGSTGKGG